MHREFVVAKTGDLQDGRMKQVEAAGIKILLARVNERYFAIGAECPHYGGPLPEGLLCCETRVICPWHLSVFDLETGHLVEPPTLDAVPRFDVRVEGDDILVAVPEGTPQYRTLPMARRNALADERTFVLVGAGAAGNAAAETLRQEGFEGRLLMITREDHVPYDRPSLSKNYLRGPEAKTPLLRDERFYANNEIEIVYNEALAVDPETRSVGLRSGPMLRYDKLLLATGGAPRRLDVPGAAHDNVLLLRTLDDAMRIREWSEAHKRVLVVGSSFIGMEVGASLAMRGLAVEVVSPETTPFSQSLGERIGGMYRRIHEENGVRFHLGATVARFEGNGRAQRAVLANGEMVEADFFVVGIGVRPATDLLRNADVNDDGSLSVDECLRLDDDHFAAGDIARFPDWRTGRPTRIEHWRLAEQHGRTAARNMLGRREAFRHVPFFWTNQFKVIVQYVGYAHEWDEVIFQGDPEEGAFLAWYVHGGRILAAAGRERDRAIMAAGELIRLSAPPAADELRRGAFDPVERLRQVAAARS